MKRTISFFLAVLLTTSLLAIPAHAAAPLSDISGHWAEDAIRQAVDEGWVNGYPDGTFRPDQTISRAEMTKLLLAATKVTPDSEQFRWMRRHVEFPEQAFETPPEYPQTRLESMPVPTFRDMASNWLTAQGWTEAAVVNGLLVPSDYYGWRFDPNQAVTRGEIAVQAARALGLVNPAQQPSKEEVPFTDRTSFEEFRTGYIREIAKVGIITGYPNGTFGSERTATRAEAVTMVARVAAEMERDELDTEQISVQLLFNDYEQGTLVETTMPFREASQMVDGVVYISLPQLLFAINNHFHVFNENIAFFAWLPLDQCISFELGKYFCQYRAGEAWLTYANNSNPDYYGLPAETRIRHGELMIPVFNVNTETGPAPFVDWQPEWDGENRVLTIPAYWVYDTGS